MEIIAIYTGENSDSFVLLDSYSAYDFINDIPTENDAYTVGRIQRMLNAIKQCIVNADATNFSTSVKALAIHLGYSTTEQHIEKLYQTAIDNKYAIALTPEKPLHCTLTMHSSKGLEFEQVILFIEDYAHFGNVSADHINNHYVACTRARTKLIIIDTDSQDAKAARSKIIEMLKITNIQAGQLISKGSV